MNKNVIKIYNDLFEKYPELEICKESITEAYQIIENSFENNCKMLVCGNGGSAADSEHITGELMKGFRLKRPIPSEDTKRICDIDMEKGKKIASSIQRALPCVSLVSQTSLLTAFSNDISADMAFAQQVYGYGGAGDILLVISTSGKSPNVCNAAIVGKALGLFTVGMTGENGGALKKYCDTVIRVPSDETYRIQEYHLPVYHALCAMLEQEFFGCL